MNHFPFPPIVPISGLSAFLFATNLVWPPVRWALLAVLCFAPCPQPWKPLRFKIAAFCDAMGKWARPFLVHTWTCGRQSVQRAVIYAPLK